MVIGFRLAGLAPRESQISSTCRQEVDFLRLYAQRIAIGETLLLGQVRRAAALGAV
jgi:hypothetical protein